MYHEDEKVISIQNRGLKYGDGIFETMKFVNGNIFLKDLHFERLFAGMKTLQFLIPEDWTIGLFETMINNLVEKNKHIAARIRLSVFRNEGDLFSDNNIPEIVIQSTAIEENALHKTNLEIEIFPDASKSCDKFSHLKSNNFLAYLMAAKYAMQLNIDDCLILNQYGRICDSTIANIFIVKDEKIFTPSLSEGCISGVYRKYLLQNLILSHFKIDEGEINVQDLENANEVFLTNSLREIMSVKKFRNKIYSNHVTKKIENFLKKYSV